MHLWELPGKVGEFDEYWRLATLLFVRLFYATADVFFVFFSVRHKNTRQPFSGTAERIFMKLLPNDAGGNGVSNVVPPPGECVAAWRMANVDDLHNLRYDSGTITRGRHARRLRYKIMRANGFNLVLSHFLSVFVSQFVTIYLHFSFRILSG